MEHHDIEQPSDTPTAESPEATIERLASELDHARRQVVARDQQIDHLTVDLRGAEEDISALKNHLVAEGMPARREAAETAAKARASLVELIDRLARAIDASGDLSTAEKVRDLAIATAVLPESISKLEDLADHELFHKAFIARHRDQLSQLLCDLAGVHDFDEIRWKGDLPSVIAISTLGPDDVLPEGFRRISSRAFHGLRSDVGSFTDRLYRFDEE
jgi:predicted DNA binding CopG/RHH family protein